MRSGRRWPGRRGSAAGSPTGSSCGSPRPSTRCADLPDDPAIDLAFIDADKPNYAGYYEELLARLRPNGVILVDNTLWHGGVIDDSLQDDNTKAIRAFNDQVAADDRVDAVLLPVSDGLTLLRKR